MNGDVYQSVNGNVCQTIQSVNGDMYQSVSGDVLECEW